MCGVIRVLHDFNESLKKSHAAEDSPVWEEVYRKAFPDFATMTNHRDNGYWQKAGIDRSVTLNTSKQILIDEKVRYKSYGDIALEYESNDKFHSPGWVCKPLQADYIAYLIAPQGVCHMLPVIQLQSAWNQYGALWMKEFQLIKAENRGYNTLSVCVPIPTLYQAIGACLRVKFNGF